MSYQRPFLKWAGGKYRLLDTLLSVLPKGKRLIEPFAGAGAVFLNAQYPRYVLNDLNTDLINLYRCLKKQGNSFIAEAKILFIPQNNNPDKYYQLREQFNQSEDKDERSALFLYLNRHGYNGLCRYNSKRKFNVPFGRYKKPTFPLQGLLAYQEKLKKTRLISVDYKSAFKQASPGDIIYCDPPYVSNHASSPLRYFGNAFTDDDQITLAELAKKAKEQGITTVLSNHDTPFTRKTYKDAQTRSVEIYRPISCNTKQRKNTKEIIAVYSIEHEP